MSEVIIKMVDVRSALNCSRGARAFFIRHNLDWSDFLKNGIPESKLSHIDDIMCKEVIENAKKRAEK